MKNKSFSEFQLKTTSMLQLWEQTRQRNSLKILIFYNGKMKRRTLKNTNQEMTTMTSKKGKQPWRGHLS